VPWPLQGAMSVGFADGRCRNLPPLGCGGAIGAGHTDEQRPRQMGYSSMFADVGPGNCQISVRKDCLQNASCSCDGLGDRRRRRTSCPVGAFCRLGETGREKATDRNARSEQAHRRMS
jgi:hypothetical protein